MQQQIYVCICPTCPQVLSIREDCAAMLANHSVIYNICEPRHVSHHMIVYKMHVWESDINP